MQLLDNLTKGPGSPSQRRILQGTTLIVQVQGSEKGYLEGTVYLGLTPDSPIEWKGLGFSTSDMNKDGIIEIPLILPFNSNKTAIPAGVGYFLKVEAAPNAGAIPTFWNIKFDIVAQE